MTFRTSEAENTTTETHDRVVFVGVVVDHHAQPDIFNLEPFEYLVTQPDTEQAARMLLLLLTPLDNHWTDPAPVKPKSPSIVFDQSCHDDLFPKLARRVRLKIPAQPLR